ncbi:hypothetical protein OAJ27_01755 [bacterium]|nr:hypothetical protein [bacterium]
MGFSSLTLYAQTSEDIDIFFNVDTQISSMSLLDESESTPFGTGYEGDSTEKFTETNRSGRIGVLEVDHNHINGFKISITASSFQISDADDDAIYGERLDFNSVSQASNDIGYIEVPYQIDCDDYDEYEYNQNSINTYIKQVVTLESDPENICVETDDLYQQSKEFLLGITLTIPESSESFFIYDELGYRTETITFTLADKV